MRFDIHLHFPCDDDVFEGLNDLIEVIENMSTELDNLVKEVGETHGVVDSVVVLLRGIKEQLDAAGTDRAKLSELAASLDAKQKELAAAAAEFAEPPPVDPPVDPTDPTDPTDPPTETTFGTQGSRR